MGAMGGKGPDGPLLRDPWGPRIRPVRTPNCQRGLGRENRSHMAKLAPLRMEIRSIFTIKPDVGHQRAQRVKFYAKI